MADSKDESGKGASRPYARIDLKASEVDGRPSASAKPTHWWAARPLRSAQAFMRGSARAMPVLTHLAAGLLGGVFAALALHSFGDTRQDERGGGGGSAALTGRLSELERALARQATGPDLRSRVDGLARAAGALEAANSKHANDLKTLQERLASPAPGTAELGERLAKLESAIA